ncbi:unnamed protein product [Parajaminaea phylloscopi]
MRTSGATAATVGLAALSAAISATGYVLPNSVGDMRFAQQEAQELSSHSGTDDRASFVRREAGGESIRLPLTYSRREALDTMDKVKDFARSQRSYIENKYGSAATLRKRQVAGLVDYGSDSFYFAQVAIGTPAQNFNLILDTGSADLWVADSDCQSSQCSASNLYNYGASSSAVRSQTPFQITYGSGAVRGTLFADTVSLAGYTVYNTTVAGVTQLATGTLRSPTSGIMGMGLQQLTTSGATPFWQVLAKSGKLQTQAFTFQLARNTQASTKGLSSGGTFTLGEIDSNQYQGDITWTNLPSNTAGQRGYWAIPLDAVSANGNSIRTSGQLAAIDTGTTLIGAPSDAVDRFYSNVPNAQPISLDGEAGYYAFPCSTNVSSSFTFSGKSWTLTADDFNGGAVTRSFDGTYFCLGSIFATDLGSNAPEWVIGDSFLKNVFSIYEYAPTERIGFAALKNGVAQSAPVDVSLVPSGAAAAAGAATSSSSGSSTAGGVGPPSISVDPSASTQTGIVGGSGLPAPVAAATNSASTPTLTSQTSSLSGSSSGRASSAASTLRSVSAALVLTGVSAVLGATMIFS